ncbi:MAG: TRAP transporter large permease [Spirochaetaceae bacterium]|jgi:tripartite ATP-independent transporter DctM subunit|nr:TRAP transporter large permease [Spirochaetaceae bacterium]
MLTFAIFGTLLIFLLLNIPVFTALGLSAVIFLVCSGGIQFLAMLPHRMYYGTTGFTLLAIPFFIFAGNLMNRGGITARIFAFAKALTGHIPGGLGQVNIMASIIFSGMSGSAVADAAGLGQIEHKAMVDDGYEPAVSASLVAASSVIGPIIPPSIPFVLYGAITGVSVARLFIAGFLPGIVLGIGMMIALAVMAKIYHYPSAPHMERISVIWAAFRRAFWALMAPVIIIGGIMSGFFTPTEASVVVTFYALILGFAYKDLKVKDLPGIITSTINQASGLLFIMAAANFFGWLILYRKLPDNIIQSLTGFGLTQNAVQWIIIGIVLIMGCFLEGNAIFMITLPIFMPIITMFNINVINFGVVMTLLIMIGNLTPPVGMCLFAVDSFAKVGVIKLGKKILPYLVVILIVTIIIAFAPEITLYLPNKIMGGGGG